MNIKLTRLSAVGAILFATAISGFSDTLWIGGLGHINDTNKWSTGLPDNSGNDGFVSSGALIAGDDDISSKKITFSGLASLQVTNNATITDANLALTSANGIFAVGSSSIVLGSGPGGMALVQLINGGADLSLIDGDLTLGGDSDGVIVQSAGTVELQNGLLTLGGAGAGTGTYLMSGGVLTTASITFASGDNWIDLSSLGTGVMEVSTNTYSISAAESDILAGNIRRDGLMDDKSFFSITEDAGFIKVQAIPEPTVIGLIGIGGLSLLISRRITKKKEVE